jgi:hypothetical protein
MEETFENVVMSDEITDDNEKRTNYVMYKVCPKNKKLNFCYIGQTANFENRKRQHIRNTSCETDKKHYHLKHYETIRNNGGWDEWEMIELEKINNKTKLEARIREQELIKEHNANLNMLSAYITEDERQANKKAITEKFRAENKEYLAEQTKKYKEEHKEVIAEQMKKYREENKEKIYQKTKEYRENNKEKHQEWQQVWREKNKEASKEKRKIYDAKKKAEKLAQKALLDSEKDPEEERIKKEQQKKEKREQYNAERREKRLQAKEALPTSI